ncbi:MAG: hypothetical protein CMM93_04475 [Rickettsiales bacterium]|nr:hypothetical protein [Rickettsiales bacterium]
MTIEMLQLHRARDMASGPLRQRIQHIAGDMPLDVLQSPAAIPNAAMVDKHFNPLRKKDAVLITEGMLRLTGDHPTRAPSQEMLAIIGHELEHLRRGVLKDGYTKLSLVFGGPLVAMAALAWYRSQSDTALASNDPTPEIQAQPNSPLLTCAAYGAAAAGGLALGSMISRAFAMHVEFLCDRAGAFATSPDAMISALKKIDNLKPSDFSKADLKSIRSIHHQLQERPLWQQYLSEWAEYAFVGHPSSTSRYAQLEKMKHNVQAPHYDGTVLESVKQALA